MVYALIIISVFIIALTLIIYLYQDHVDYLNDKIEKMQIELDVTLDCLDTHKEMVEDLEGYYEKWRETVADLDEANQKVWELTGEIADLEIENRDLSTMNEELEQRIHCFEEYE